MKKKPVNCCLAVHYPLNLQFLNVKKRDEHLYETVVIPLCQKSSIYYLLVGS